MCYCPTPTLHLNLALTGDGAFLFSLKKTHSVWFISVLNYGDTENVLINHLLLVIPMSYPCHYTNLCPHKPHKHAHTHTHTHTHTHRYNKKWVVLNFHENNFPSQKGCNGPKNRFYSLYETLFIIYLYLVVKYDHRTNSWQALCDSPIICTQAFKKHIVLWKYTFHGNYPPDIHTMILPDFQPSAVRFHRNMWQGLPDERDFNLMVSWRQATWGTKEQIVVIFSNVCVQR